MVWAPFQPDILGYPCTNDFTPLTTPEAPAVYVAITGCEIDPQMPVMVLLVLLSLMLLPSAVYSRYWLYAAKNKLPLYTRGRRTITQPNSNYCSAYLSSIIPRLRGGCYLNSVRFSINHRSCHTLLPQRIRGTSQPKKTDGLEHRRRSWQQRLFPDPIANPERHSQVRLKIA